jgi:hypothetical protein
MVFVEYCQVFEEENRHNIRAGEMGKMGNGRKMWLAKGLRGIEGVISDGNG